MALRSRGLALSQSPFSIVVISARITLVFDENTPAEKRETLNVPMRKIGDLMLVRSFRRGA